MPLSTQQPPPPVRGGRPHVVLITDMLIQNHTFPCILVLLHFCNLSLHIVLWELCSVLFRPPHLRRETALVVIDLVLQVPKIAPGEALVGHERPNDVDLGKEGLLVHR